MTNLSFLLERSATTSSHLDMLKTILDSLNTQSHRKTIALVESLIQQEKNNAKTF